MLWTLSSSTDPDYATTGDVLSLLHGATTTDVVGTTQEIDHLSRLVRRASAWVEGKVGEPLAVATYRETVAGYGDRYLRLSRWPVRAVRAVYDATDTGSASDITSDVLLEDRDAGLLARDRGFAWTNTDRISGGDMSMGLTGAHLPGAEMKPYLVEYVAGYVPLGGITCGAPNWTTGAVEGTSTGPTLPDDLRHAVALRVLEFQANPMGVSSRRLGDLAVTYANATGFGGAGRTVSAAEEWLAPYMSAG
jgi:hypothetical protein